MNSFLYTALGYSEPSAWWGFLALLIPVFIHLLSKKERSVVSFGSIRFLQEMESDSARSILLSQYTLLLIRMLLITLMCLLLIDPFWNRSDETISYWVEDEIFESEQYHEFLKNLPLENEINVFSFQNLDSMEINHFESGWSFIEHLNSIRDSTIVYTHSLLKDYNGSPVEATKRINWKTIPIKSIDPITNALRKDEESIQWWINADQMKLEVGTIESDDTGSPSVVSLRLISNDFEQEAAIIKNVINITSRYLPYDIEWNTNEIAKESGKYEWNIVVGEGTQSIEGNSIFWIPSKQRITLEPIDDSSLIIRGQINKENILSSNLPVAISSYFNKKFVSLFDHDIRVIDPMRFRSSKNETYLVVEEDVQILDKKLQKPLNTYLLLLFMPIFYLERFLNHKNREIA
jgi:hypothetical protein